jgi:predicted PurR-regulated permease PerM
MRNATIWRVAVIALLAALTLAAADLLVPAVSSILLVFAGVLFGIFLHGVADSIAQRTPLSYRWAYTLVVVALVATIVGAGFWMGAQIVAQVSELIGQIQSASDRVQQYLEHYPQARRYLPEVKPEQVASQAAQALPAVNTGVQWLVWGLTGVVVVLFVGLYIAYQPDLYLSGLVKLAPPEQRGRAGEILGKLHSVLVRWIIGRIASMALVGLLTAAGLWMLGVPLPVTLAVIAALLTFIPNLGPLLAAVPQALLALQAGTSTVAYVILFNIALQTVESYLITPIIERRQVTLPPAMTISAQLLMGVLFGAIGMIMAAPLTASAMLLAQTLYIRDRLGDPKPGKLTETS